MIILDVEKELEYRVSKRVTECKYFISLCTSFPICPTCRHLIDREYLSYCSTCGQKLDWRYYRKAKTIIIERNGSNKV